MAAPGIGVGDIVLACQTIVKYCQRYRDAPEEYDEISGKARSLEITLERIKAENLYKGSIVKRAENPAEAQVQNILRPLYDDLRELEKIVLKFANIHADGYGRRLIFAFTQSGDLADLRRKIGLHEQALQMWYMTVIVSSLRRIEGGVEGLREILNAMRNWSPKEEKKVREQVARRACSRSQSRTSSRPFATVGSVGASRIEEERMSSKSSSKPAEVTEEDVEPLKEALEKSGVSQAAIDSNLQDAIKYLFAESDRKKEEIEAKAKAEEKDSKQRRKYDDFDRQEEVRRKQEREDRFRKEKELFRLRAKEEDMRRQYEKKKLAEAKADEDRTRLERSRRSPKVSRETATSYRNAPPSYHTVDPTYGPSIRIHHEDSLPIREHPLGNLHRSRSARESKKVSFDDELYTPLPRPRASSGSQLEPYNHERPSLFLNMRPYNEYSDMYDVLERRVDIDRRSDSGRSSNQELVPSPRLSPVLAERSRRSPRHLSVSTADESAIRRVERSVSPSSSITRYIVRE